MKPLVDAIYLWGCPSVDAIYPLGRCLPPMVMRASLPPILRLIVVRRPKLANLDPNSIGKAFRSSQAEPFTMLDILPVRG